MCYESFGDRVKFWITINEPQVVANQGYGHGWMAPGIKGEEWRARYNTVRAHTRAYHIYVDEFKEKQGGVCGITLNCDWYEPKTDSEADRNAAQLQMDLQLGFWADPIFATGDYPDSMKRVLGEKLPRFTPEEIEANKGSSDFFGLNHYTARILEPCDSGHGDLGGHCDHVFQIRSTTCSLWPTSGSSWLYSVPWAFRRLLKYIHDTYDSQKYPIYHTENGISSRDNGTDFKPELNDQWRIDHYRSVIGQMHRAIYEDKVNIKQYTAWSLFDNFEWAKGYSERFGLIWVNFTDPERQVFWKDSAKYYKTIVLNNTVEGSSSSALRRTSILSFILGIMLTGFFC